MWYPTPPCCPFVQGNRRTTSPFSTFGSHVVGIHAVIVTGISFMTEVYRLGYRPDIEGLRAIAVGLVVAAHMKLPGLQGGFIGVDVFFVLSGYLITALLVREIEATGRVNLWEFYARRLRRLMPGLLLMLVAACFLAWAILLPSQQYNQAKAAASTVLWLSNFYFAFNRLDYFDPRTEDSLFLHTWSLGVEEQFYLLWPGLLWLAFWWIRHTHRDDPLRQLRTFLMLVFGASLVLCQWLMIFYPTAAFYMMPARTWQFCLGALTWIVLRQPGTALTKTLPHLGWPGLFMIVLAALWYGPQMSYPGLRALWPSLGAVLLLAAGCRASPPPKCDPGCYRTAGMATLAGGGASLLFLVFVALADSGAGRGDLRECVLEDASGVGPAVAAAGLVLLPLGGGSESPAGALVAASGLYGGRVSSGRAGSVCPLPELARKCGRGTAKIGNRKSGYASDLFSALFLRSNALQQSIQGLCHWRSRSPSYYHFVGRQYWWAMVSRLGNLCPS
jgi:peptidoglycan/LPS O-acetylase OafA/YrhL